MTFISSIATNIAPPKLAKKLLKRVKKNKHARGVREVTRCFRKNEHGFVLLAADVFPIDCVAHIPILCEENNVPYIFVETKEQLGKATLTKNPATAVMVMETNDPKYQECLCLLKKVSQ